MNLLVTGGCGFIGSNFIQYVLNKKLRSVHKIVNFDCLSYAGNEKNVDGFENDPKYIFIKGNLKNYSEVFDAVYKHDITHIMHLAAESHVDNSIIAPDVFIESNIIGTFNLLKVVRQLNVKRLHHVSTDEVYGELGKKGKFKETTPYDPRNPYSASKASADMLARAFFHTYKLNVTLSNCCNNYGPRQHEEKFMPTVIDALMHDRAVPVYGDGKNVRDWIYVEDHCHALWKILKKGEKGETYNVGANCEKSNLEIVKKICDVLGKNFRSSVKFVKDRPGHDFRYAIDNKKITSDLKWKPNHNFEEAIKKTVKWYKSECK